VPSQTPLGVHRPVAGAVLPAVNDRRAFPIAGARVWNALPSDGTSAPLLAVFGRRLKTELFRRCYNAV